MQGPRGKADDRNPLQRRRGPPAGARSRRIRSFRHMASQPAEKRFSHKKLERNVSLLGFFSLIAVAIGGIVEIAPLFWIDNTIEKVDGMRPYTPLELDRKSTRLNSSP